MLMDANINDSLNDKKITIFEISSMLPQETESFKNYLDNLSNSVNVEFFHKIMNQVFHVNFFFKIFYIADK